MNTMMAFAMGEAHRNDELKVFDWNKAAMLIKQRQPQKAEAGLEDDLEWTCGTIWENNKPVIDNYAYLASTWATPLLILDEEEIPCYVMEHETCWDAQTKWPESALQIVGYGGKQHESL